MFNNYTRILPFRQRKLFFTACSIVASMLVSVLSWSQVTVTGGTNTTPNLSATYTSLANAITDLNTVTAVSGPVTISLDPANPETAPLGGYIIDYSAATGLSSTNSISIVGNNNTITGANITVAAGLNDAIFKVVGSDFLTISGFVITEDNTNNVTVATAATNDMHEFGIAIYYKSQTDGAKNVTIQNNTISLNRNYGNAMGIYATSRNSSAAYTTLPAAADITNASGAHDNLRIYGNTINNVVYPIYVIGSTTAANFATGLDIGGTTALTGNTLTNFGNAGGLLTTFLGVTSATTINGIAAVSQINFNISRNTITAANTAPLIATAIRGIGVEQAATPTGTISNSINNNTIFLYQNGASAAVNGITCNTGNTSTTLAINSNNIRASYTNGASQSGAFTGITNGGSGNATSISISSNDFNNITSAIAGTYAVTLITMGTLGGNLLTYNANSNTATALNLLTSGNFAFISGGSSLIAGGTKNINSNSFVTSFAKNAGGTVSFYSDNASSVAGSTINMQNNNLSNVTLSGATASATNAFFANTDGGTPTKNITGNTFNNWTLGTSAFVFMLANFNGNNTTISNNSFTNITGQGAITALSVGASGGVANHNIQNNSINTISSTGTGGAVIGITSSSPATTASTISGNTIHTLSTTNTTASVTGITSSGAFPVISGNTVRGLSSTGTTGVAVGIALTGGTTINVTKNKVGDLSVSTAGGTVTGLNMTSGTTFNVNNNLIGDLRAPAATGLNAIIGINASATATYNMFYNSVYLNATSSSVTTFGNTCVNFSSTATTLNLRNNLLYNNSVPAQNGSNAAANGIAACLRRSAGTAATVPANYNVASNNNVFWANPTSGTNNHMTYVEGTVTITNPQNTVASMKAFMVNRDQASNEENVAFQSTTVTSADFLKYNTGTASFMEAQAVNIAGITDDYNATIRQGNVGYTGSSVGGPDVGAWELNGVAPACTATPGSVGTASPTSVAVCGPGEVVPALTYNGGAGMAYSGLSYVWEEAAAAGGPYSPATGGTGAATLTYTPPLFAGPDIYYRLSVSCPAAGPTTVSGADIPVLPLAAPSTQASAITSGTITTSSIVANFTAGNGGGRAVYINNTNSFVAPTGPASPGTPNTVWQGSGQQLVMLSNASTVTVTGLASGGTYFFRVYEYNSCIAAGPTTNYAFNSSTAAGNPNSFATTTTVGNAYAFSQSVGTYTTLTGGTSLQAGTGFDDATVNVTFPFSFNYNGAAYTTGKTGTNGFLSFGTTYSGDGRNAITSADGQLVTAMSLDLGSGSSSYLLSEHILGTAPFRQYVLQWRNVSELGNGDDYNFQIILEEANGDPTLQTVTIMYGGFTTAAAPTVTPAVGIKGGSPTNFNARTVSTAAGFTTGNFNWSNSATATTSAATMPVNTIAGYGPVSGLTFVWTPTGTCGGPPASGGTAILTSINACAGSNAVPGILYVSGESQAPGLAYQWQQSATSGGALSNVTGGSGGNTVQYTLPAPVVTSAYYKLRVSCGNNHTYSNEIFVGTQAPSTQTSAITGTGTCAGTGITINWTSGNGTNRAVYINDVNSWTNPTDGVALGAANTVYGGAGQQLVAISGSSVTVTGLVAGNTYYFRIYEFNCTGSPLYNFSNNTATIVNTVVAPTNQTTSMGVSTITPVSANLTMTAGNGLNGRVVYINSVNSFVAPADGTSPVANTVWANAGQQCVLNAAATTVTVTGLTPGTTYYIRSYEVNCTGTSTVYQTSSNATNPVGITTKQYASFTPSMSSAVYAPVTGGTQLWASGGGNIDDATSGALTFPFPFTYRGETVTQFSVCTNGWMALGTATQPVATGTAFANNIGTGTSGAMALMPFFEDLYISGAGIGQRIAYEVTGTPGSQVLTVDWTNVEVFNYPGPALNFQVKLYEADDHVEFHYGNMQGFDGTLGNYNTVNGLTFNYSVGLSSGYTNSTPPLPGEIMGLQQINTNSWSHLGFQTTNVGNNALASMPDCDRLYTFTPSLTTYTQDPAPAAPSAPSNDDPTGAITVNVPLTPPTNFCGNYYSSAFATPTAGYSLGSCATVNADDDIWFRFEANSTATSIDLRGSGGYDAVIQVFDGGPDNTVTAPISTTPLTCINNTNMTGAANSAGLTESVSNYATVVGRTYFVRVFHAGGGTQAVYNATVSAGSVTGFTSVTNGTGYITSGGGFGGVVSKPQVYITGTNTQGVKVDPTVTGGAITALTISGGQDGYGQISGPVTVTIAPPSAGLTGAFAMNVFATPTPPGNDDIAASVNVPYVLTSALTCTNTSGTTINATQSPQLVGCGNPDDDVWYSFVAATPADVITVDPAGPNFNPTVEVWSSSNNLPGGTLTSLGCQDAGGNGVTEVYTNSGLTPGNTYFVRVYSNLAGTIRMGNFDICVTGVAPSCPSYISPADLGTVATTSVTLSWNAVGNATLYDVYLDQVDGTTTLVSANQAGTTYNGTITAGSWFWSVVAKNALGNSGACTVRSFSTAAPGCPTLSSPANGASVYFATGTTLGWSAPVSGALHYDVFLDQNPTPTTLVGNDVNALFYATGALVQNVTYYWRIEANGSFGTSSGCSTGNFITNAPQPPANDEPCNATPLTVGSACTFTNSTNLNASSTAGVPAPGCASYQGGDVWFSVVVPANGSIDVRTQAGVITDGGLALYSATGTCPSLTFTLIECDDDDGVGAMSLISRTGLTPGSTIYIRVWEFGNNNNGTFGISVSSPVPIANDDFCTATVLTVGNGCSPVTGNNIGATATSGPPAPSCGTPNTDIWFQFVVPASGHVLINTQVDLGCQALGDGVMALYSATGSCPSPTFTQVACDDDAGPGLLPAIDQTGLTPGATMYIRFWGFGSSSGTFGLCVIDGSATPPANDVPSGAITAPVSGNAYPSCGALLGDCSLASDSPEDAAPGNDVWYKFVAQSPACRVRMVAGGMNNVIELFDNTLTAMPGGFENATGTVGGTEILNYIGAGLTVGQTYYVCVGSNDANTGGPFSLCIQSLRASTCADGPGSYDLCTNFKPTYTGANTYLMAFTQTLPTPGPTTSASTTNQLALSTSSLALRHTYSYSVAISAVYNLTDGAGNPETITVPNSTPCVITIAPHGDLRTKFAQRCPATVLKGTTLQANPFICAATSHVITFKEVGDCAGTDIGGVPFTSTTSGASPSKKLSQVSGVQSGKYYEVYWTPQFGYGAGTPGTTDIIFVAASASAEETAGSMNNEMESDKYAIDANIYPNPNNGDMVNLNITDIVSDNVFVRIFDNMGRVIYVNRFTVDGSLNTNVTFTKPLANGLYMVEFTVDGETFTERMIVEK